MTARSPPPKNSARSTAAAIATKLSRRPPLRLDRDLSTPTCPNRDAWRGAVATTEAPRTNAKVDSE